MASVSTIPPRHVDASSLQQDAGEPDHGQWPQLDPSQQQPDEWELVPPAPQVTFQPDTIHTEKQQGGQLNPKHLKHSQSSPDFRKISALRDVDEEEESAVMIEEGSIASSSMTMVSGPGSVWSVGSNRLSFRDAILQKSEAKQEDPDDMGAAQTKLPRKVVKPKFLVVRPIKRCSFSMPNLHALDEDGDVMGDTDAHEYYNRKAQGAMGRMNGSKLRPDEAKRLQMTMNKKNLQRERQTQRG